MDINAIKSKLATLQSTTSNKDNFWKPEPGTQVVRVVPYKHNKDNPFIELYFHYNLGNNKTYLSPMSFGRPDPVAEFADKLKSTGNSDDWKLSKKLEPKMRTYVPVLVRGQEGEGVKLWGFGKQVYTELLGFITDPDYGDITDPGSGRDIVVDFTPSEGVGTYPKTTIRVKPNQTAATADKAIAEKIMTGQEDIFNIFKKVSYDDLKKALEEWLDPSTNGEVVTDLPWENNDTKKEPATATTGQPASTTKSTDDISAAFDDLFNQ